MARNKPYRDPQVVRESVTLMPVSPNSEQGSESLSHDGETVANQDQEIIMGDGARAPGRGIPDETRREVDSDDGGDDSGDDDGVIEARAAKGQEITEGSNEEGEGRA